MMGSFSGSMLHFRGAPLQVNMLTKIEKKSHQCFFDGQYVVNQLICWIFHESRYFLHHISTSVVSTGKSGFWQRKRYDFAILWSFWRRRIQRSYCWCFRNPVPRTTDVWKSRNNGVMAPSSQLVQNFWKGTKCICYGTLIYFDTICTIYFDLYPLVSLQNVHPNEKLPLKDRNDWSCRLG